MAFFISRWSNDRRLKIEWNGACKKPKEKQFCCNCSVFALNFNQIWIGNLRLYVRFVFLSPQSHFRFVVLFIFVYCHCWKAFAFYYTYTVCLFTASFIQKEKKNKKYMSWSSLKFSNESMLFNHHQRQQQ